MRILLIIFLLICVLCTSFMQQKANAADNMPLEAKQTKNTSDAEAVREDIDAELLRANNEIEQMRLEAEEQARKDIEQAQKDLEIADKEHDKYIFPVQEEENEEEDESPEVK